MILGLTSSDTGIAFTDRENIYKGGIDLRSGVIEGRIFVHLERVRRHPYSLVVRSILLLNRVFLDCDGLLFVVLSQSIVI